MSKSTGKGKKGKIKRESADGSKGGFEVQPRSGGREASAVIAAGYQFSLLLQEIPQHGGVSRPRKASRDHPHLCRRAAGGVKRKGPQAQDISAPSMERRVASITNTFEITIISSGQVGKAKNYFSFCFLRKLRYIAARVPCNRASFGQTRQTGVTKTGRRADGEAPANTPQSQRLPAMKKTRARGTPEGSCQR